MHDKEEDCWLGIDDKVYDFTNLLKWHPGGSLPVRKRCGTDASKYFHIHHPNDEFLVSYFPVGQLVNEGVGTPKTDL